MATITAKQFSQLTWTELEVFTNDIKEIFIKVLNGRVFLSLLGSYPIADYSIKDFMSVINA